jgi:hypothetical protein
VSKRGNGEDSVYKDGDRWRGAISLGWDANGSRTRKRSPAVLMVRRWPSSGNSVSRSTRER